MWRIRPCSFPSTLALTFGVWQLMWRIRPCFFPSTLALTSGVWRRLFVVTRTSGVDQLSLELISDARPTPTNLKASRLLLMTTTSVGSAVSMSFPLSVCPYVSLSLSRRLTLRLLRLCPSVYLKVCLLVLAVCLLACLSSVLSIVGLSIYTSDFVGLAFSLPVCFYYRLSIFPSGYVHVKFKPAARLSSHTCLSKPFRLFGFLSDRLSVCPPVCLSGCNYRRFSVVKSLANYE